MKFLLNEQENQFVNGPTVDPIIEVKHISKQYKIGVDATYKTLKNYNRLNEIFRALKDINFEMNRGEVLAVRKKRNLCLRV